MAFLLPAVVLVLLFYLLPNLLNFVLAFTDWSGARSQVRFIGWRNFVDFFADDTIRSAIWTTIRYAFIVMVVENAVALALALALQESTKLNVFLRLIFFTPVLISPLATGYIFSGLLHPNGAYNAIFSAFAGLLGLPRVDYAWLGSVNLTLLVVACIHAWKFGGIHMFVYIAGLMAIPRETAEAARIDGAGPLRVFRHVTIPLLGPAMTFNITLTLIGALSVFDLVLATTRGGPGSATKVLNMIVYGQFGQGAFGFSTAISAALFVLIILVAAPLITYLRRREVTL
jgi:raffinose/stachyose/melibiose transport system permease protein